MIKLKGLYPSVNLNGAGCSAGLTDFWFSNHLNEQMKPQGSLVNHKNQEVEVKVRALKLSNFIEEQLGNKPSSEEEVRSLAWDAPECAIDGYNWHP